MRKFSVLMLGGALVLGCSAENSGSSGDEATFGSPWQDATSYDAGAKGPVDAGEGSEEATDTVAPDPGPEDVGVPDPEDVAAPEDVVEPEDTGPEKDWGKVTPDTVVQDDPGGFLDEDASQDCAALDLPVSWSGTFDGDITSNWGDVSVDGTMAFEIECLGGKLVVWGDMSGLGEGQPFTLKIQGSYNPETNEIKAKLVEGSVALFWVLPVAFEGDLEGEYDGSGFAGVWEGTNTDKTVLDASGTGTWVAGGQ